MIQQSFLLSTRNLYFRKQWLDFLRSWRLVVWFLASCPTTISLDPWRRLTDKDLVQVLTDFCWMFGTNLSNISRAAELLWRRFGVVWFWFVQNKPSPLDQSVHVCPPTFCSEPQLLLFIYFSSFSPCPPSSSSSSSSSLSPAGSSWSLRIFYPHYNLLTDECVVFTFLWIIREAELPAVYGAVMFPMHLLPHNK